jgi:DNA ligase (NAD+)
LLENLKQATFEQLIEVDEVGERIAQSIVSFFSDPKNIELINRLEDAGITLRSDVTPSAVENGVLSGQSVVISGTFSRISRDELKELVIQHGGKIVSSVSASTNLLIAGDKMGPAKLDKATKLGVKIISEDDLFELIK